MKKNDLHTIKTSGFKTPDNFFESFDGKVLQQLDTKTIIKDIEDTGFNVPDNYFDTVETVILDKVVSKDKTKLITLSTKRAFYYISGIAASVLLLISIFNWDDGTTNNNITIEMVETYFENSDLNSYELADLLSETEFLEDDFSIVETEYDEDNIEAYLLENSDLETILIQ